MKVFKIFCILCFFLSSSPMAWTQISQGGEPPSFSLGLPESAVQMKRLPEVSNAEIAKWEGQDIQDGREWYRVGIPEKVRYNLQNSGTWQTLPNGDKIWRFRLESKNAVGLTFQFDDFFLPAGARLFIYNDTRTHVLGAYTSFNNSKAYIFATEILRGNSATLEYIEPFDKIGEGHISINEVGLIYKDCTAYIEEGLMEDDPEAPGCHVNINCAEGDNHQLKKKGVARWLVGGSCFCTGSLLMRNNNDFEPFFLTADHCVDPTWDAISNPNMNGVFYFNYERPDCGDTGALPIQTISGGVVRANDDTNSSDFAIIELNNNPAAFFDVFFNGWSRNVPPAGGVGVHHPGCVPKVIATYTMVPDQTCNGSRYHHVQYIATANGHSVTEGGSSGSPLFNSSGNVIGQLFGVFGSCGNNGNCGNPTNDQSNYGKISYSWGNNGATDSRRRLRDWISPTDPNLTFLFGDQPCVPNITLRGNIDSRTYSASSFVLGFGNVASTSTLTIQGGDYVEFREGFDALDGCNLTARIQSCTTPAPLAEPVDTYNKGVALREENPSTELAEANLTAFPNPFARTATISYYVPDEVPVSLFVYDLVGRLVATPVTPQTILAKGQYTATFDGSSLTSGTYRVVLRTGEQFRDMKLVLMK